MTYPRRGPASPPERVRQSPSKPGDNPSAIQASLFPRRPTSQRADGEMHLSPSAGSRLATSLALATNVTLMSAAAAGISSSHGSATTMNGKAGVNDGGNSHVRAIQSRVAELVRRYDETMEGESSEVDDEDGSRLEVPTRWRVGDLLLATHSSLAKTSTRTERAMMSDFTEDSDIVMAIGEGEHSFSLVLEDAAEKAEQMKAVLAKTLQVVRHLQVSEEIEGATEKGAHADSQKMRDLKITVDALHKEKAMILSQLHEHVKSHKEMMSTMEDQSQELKKAQIAIAMKNDELKNARDDFTQRLGDLQKMTETSQQNVTMWRDKFQSTLKALGEADTKAAELEQRVHAQAEEVMKHDFILRAKNSELEKLKERLKESELARMRAETALREAANAAAESASEAATANKRAEAAAKAKVATSSGDGKLSIKERQDLEGKIRQHEATIRNLQSKMSDLIDTRSKFEDDNNELARIVRELQSRAQEVMKSTPQVNPVPALAPKLANIRRATSFSLSLRSIPSQKRLSSRDVGGARTLRQSERHDDLSTSSDEDDNDSDLERDERELNETVQQVVTSVFSQRISPMEDQSDEQINMNIAQYEQDPTALPITIVIEDDVTTYRRLTTSQPGPESQSRPTSRSNSVDRRTSGNSERGGNAYIAELEQLRLTHSDEIARLKKQYVTGLLEYKKLIIEQYERRQNEIQQHHRMEIENLILVVQEKFKRELERRGERVLQAKESLKLLYRAMRGSGTGGDLGVGARGGLGPFPEEEEGVALKGGEQLEESVPLKSILRAAVFAMSSSKSRNRKAKVEISSIYDNLESQRRLPRKPIVKVVVKNETRAAEPVAVQEAKPDSGNTDWAAFLQNMRGNRGGLSRPGGLSRTAASLIHVGCQVDERDFVIFDLKGLRDGRVAPENLEGYVLPASGLLSRPAEASTEELGGARRLVGRSKQLLNGALTGVLFLNEGALISDDIVVELRSLLPFLPPGSYFLSGALRHQLLLAMLRFYAELGNRHGGRREQEPLQTRESRDEPVEVLVGSPRDTPFLRRKALETVDCAQRRRAQLSNGGLAMLRPAAATSIPLAGSVSAAMATSALSHMRHHHLPSVYGP